jgi:hypothetical protein
MDPAALKAQVRDSYATAEALAVHRKRLDQGLRIRHVSDLGESWNNVFVMTCRS